MTEMPVKRLNWGCGLHRRPGWINCDKKKGDGIDIGCDIRQGLSLADDSMDYIVSIHALQEVPYDGLIPALRELRRVLKPEGTLRLCLPDLDKGIQAYQRHDRDYFLIPDEEAKSRGGKFILQMLWYGHSRMLFTPDFMEELLLKAGFQQVNHCRHLETRSPHSGIVELDNREQESFFVEAVK